MAWFRRCQKWCVAISAISFWGGWLNSEVKAKNSCEWDGTMDMGGFNMLPSWDAHHCLSWQSMGPMSILRSRSQMATRPPHQLAPRNPRSIPVCSWLGNHFRIASKHTGLVDLFVNGQLIDNFIWFPAFEQGLVWKVNGLSLGEKDHGTWMNMLYIHIDFVSSTVSKAGHDLITPS